MELFSCSGGMAEGFRRAGIVFDMVVDYDEDACASYTRNLGHAPIRMDVRDLLRMVRMGWRPAGGLELLVADPPCTPWSRAGKRQGLEDERDMLEETVDLIRALRPRTYLIGNVPGLEDAPSWGVVQRVIGGLRSEGYCVADFATLDAADYGVPQRRIRPFWFGHLEGPCIRWPSPTHCDPKELRTGTLPGIEALRPWVTCREALEALPREEWGRPWKMRERARPTGRKTHARASDIEKPSKVVCSSSLGDGNVLLVENPKHPRCELDAPARTLSTDGARHQGNTLTIPGTSSPTSRDAIPPPGHHPEKGSILAQPGVVLLSERAGALLQGFPIDWHFAGRTKRARWAQIGMAMPPQLAEAVARAMVAQAEAVIPLEAIA